MFTYHGWIELEDERYSLKWRNGEIDAIGFRARLLEIASQLEKLVDTEFDIPKSDFSIMDGSNGLITIHLSGERNHYRSDPEELLEWVRVNAPNSHGLLYTRDDEHPSYDNEYRVYRLAKKKIQEFSDQLLSPASELWDNKST